MTPEQEAMMSRVRILVVTAVVLAAVMLVSSPAAATDTYTVTASASGSLPPGETFEVTASCDEGDPIDARGDSFSGGFGMGGNVRVASQILVIRPTGSWTLVIANESAVTETWGATVTITCRDDKPYRV